MTTCSLSLQVNGQPVQRDVAPGLLLVELLRDTLNLTGTHQGCDTAQCGACTVLADGQAIKACNVRALQMHGRAITTIEGLAPAAGELHVMQQAFSTHHGLQCGFCTPGMVMRAVAMQAEAVPAQPQAVRHALAGNLCRCTGYEGIVDAICSGLKAMRCEASGQPS